MPAGTDVVDLYRRGVGFDPYPWQIRLAEEGLPELLEAPTGSGKTSAVVVAWLYRLLHHPDPEVRGSTPRRLVFTLPMRVLVEQVSLVVENLLKNLDLSDTVSLATLLGGQSTDDTWRLNPHKPTVVVCTLDMGLSGALNRGYGVSRYSWPVTFGLLNSGSHWVFDEVQLMGPAAATSRQLQAFRHQMGTALPTSSTWMSATLDPAQLTTVDAGAPPSPFCLGDGDESPELTKRLDAQRLIAPWLDGPAIADKKAMIGARASAIAKLHRPGTRTVAVVNTVEAARALHASVRKLLDFEPILLHSRFRPADRKHVLEQVLAPPGEDGTVIISTQVIEAGVDLTCSTLFTEAAPWSSIVQRIGRCNRYGEEGTDEAGAPMARVLWDRPTSHPPYRDEEIDGAVNLLESVTGEVITTRSLSAIPAPPVPPPLYQVARRPDLLRLFDTAPDLAGNDVDVGPFLRDGDDLDVQVCWREFEGGAPASHRSPTRSELCPVPVSEMRKWAAKRTDVLVLNHQEQAGRRGRPTWVKATAETIIPGQLLMVDSRAGGYSPTAGWDPKIIANVAPVVEPTGQHDLTPIDETMSDDPASIASQWIELGQHLSDVEAELIDLCKWLGPCDLPLMGADSLVAAGRWHDLGKVHPVFQDTMARTAGDDGPPAGSPWAKSGGTRRASHSRRHFRHELASALALDNQAGVVLSDDVDRDLVIYLVASHHGRVRMSIRSFPGEDPPLDGSLVALGVHDGETLPGGTFAGVTVPEAQLSLDVMALGSERSWVARAVTLRDREDLGPFRLAFLEALLRVADWRVSASYEAPSQQNKGNDNASA